MPYAVEGVEVGRAPRCAHGGSQQEDAAAPSSSEGLRRCSTAPAWPRRTQIVPKHTNRAELAALRAQVEGKEAEHAAELERQQVQAEALKTANDRIRKAEVRAAAKGVLADPADAFKFLDLDEIDVDDEGAVDTAALESALKSLIESKPYLAAQSGSRFEGSGDGGHRNEAPMSQLTEAQLSSMSPAEINEARRTGRLDRVLGKL